MAYMMIYRVETVDGRGPWCSPEGSWDGGAGTAWCNNANSIHEHAHELLYKTKNKITWRFGFMSLPQMLHYMLSFDPLHVTDYDRECLIRGLETMARYKLVINVYRSDAWGQNKAIGDVTQCIFDKDSAELLFTIDPTGEVMRKVVHEYGRLEQELREAAKKAVPAIDVALEVQKVADAQAERAWADYWRDKGKVDQAEALNQIYGEGYVKVPMKPIKLPPASSMSDYVFTAGYKPDGNSTIEWHRRET